MIMMKSRAIFLLITVSLLSSCYAIETTRTYNKSMTRGHSSSEPIYLSFVNSQHSSYYFLLERDITSSNYTLKVRWISPDHELQFKGTESSLKFFVNTEEIISVLPTKLPKIAAYRIDDGGLEEEACYTLSKEQLERIAYAKSVSVELTGKYKIVIGKLNKFHSFRAMRDFLKNG